MLLPTLSRSAAGVRSSFHRDLPGFVSYRIVPYHCAPGPPSSTGPLATEASKQAPKQGRQSRATTHEAGPATASARVIPPGLVTYPLLDEVIVGERLHVVEPRVRSRLLGVVEAEKGRDRGDHVSHGEVGAVAAHHVGGVKLDQAEADAALGLAHPGLDQGLHQRADVAAGRAP